MPLSAPKRRFVARFRHEPYRGTTTAGDNDILTCLGKRDEFREPCLCLLDGNDGHMSPDA